MSIRVASELPWRYSSEFDVWFTFVDSSHVTYIGGLQTLEGLASISDLTQCRDRRADSHLSLLLRIACKEVVSLVTGCDIHDCYRIRTRCPNCGKQHGRPVYATPRGIAPLHVSVSHSHGLGALAVSRRRQLGIDVQRLIPTRSIPLLRKSLHINESALIAESGLEFDRKSATRLWARKEALGKAYGQGLCGGLAQFDTSLWPIFSTGAFGLDLGMAGDFSGALVMRVSGSDLPNAFSGMCS